jgi:hypothetical protein
MTSINEQYRVSDSQLDAATRFVNCATNEVLYTVKSASEANKTYNVTWNTNFSRFQCECKASHNGMCCWHVRSALANEMIYRQNVRAEQEAAQRIAEEKAEMERLLMVKPTRPSEKAVKSAVKRNQPQGFSLLR